MHRHKGTPLQPSTEFATKEDNIPIRTSKVLADSSDGKLAVKLALVSDSVKEANHLHTHAAKNIAVNCHNLCASWKIRCCFDLLFLLSEIAWRGTLAIACRGRISNRQIDDE